MTEEEELAYLKELQRIEEQKELELLKKIEANSKLSPEVSKRLYEKEEPTPAKVKSITEPIVNNHSEKTAFRKNTEQIVTDVSNFAEAWGDTVGTFGFNVLSGVYQAGANLGAFVSKVAGADELAKDFAKEAKWAKDLGKEVAKKADRETVGTVGEIAGQVGTAIMGTGGINVVGSTNTTRMLYTGSQAMLAETVFFAGNDGNIATALKQWGVDNAVVNFLADKSGDEDAMIDRFKNGLAGAVPAVAIQRFIDIWQPAKKLLNEADTVGKEDDELINLAFAKYKEVEELLEEAPAVAKTVEEAPLSQTLQQAEQGMTGGINKMADEVTEQVIKPMIMQEGKVVGDYSLAEIKAVYQGQPKFYGDTIHFQDDVTRLIYVAGGKSESSKKYMKWLTENTGLDEASVKVIREDLLKDVKKGKVGQERYAKHIDDYIQNIKIKNLVDEGKVLPESLARASVEGRLFDEVVDLYKTVDKDGAVSEIVDGTYVKKYVSNAETDDKALQIIKDVIGIDDISVKASAFVDNLHFKVKDLSPEVRVAMTIEKALLSKAEKTRAIARETGDSADKLRAILDFNQAKVYSHKVKEIAGEVGRTLQLFRSNAEMTKAYKILDDAMTTDPSWTNGMIDTLIKNDRQLQKLWKAIDKPELDVAEMYKHLNDSRIRKLGNVISEVAIDNMLSSPYTLMVNAMGGEIVRRGEYIRNVGQFLIGNLRGSSEAMSWNRMKAITRAEFNHTREDIMRMIRTTRDYLNSGLKDEAVSSNILVPYKTDQHYQQKFASSEYLWGDKVENVSKTVRNAVDVAGRFSRTSYNTIALIDDYYKRGLFRTELTRLAGEIADNRGITSAKEYTEFIDRFVKTHQVIRTAQNKGAKIPKQFLEDNADIIPNGGATHYSDIASDYARWGTFQDEIKWKPLANAVDALNSNGYLRTIVPFKLTPINILKMASDFMTTPVRTLLNKQLYQGGKETDKLLADLVLSTTIMGGMWHILDMDSLNFVGRIDKEELNSAKTAGIMPYSIQIGNEWVEIKQLDPIATPLGIMMDLKNLADNLSLYVDTQQPREEMQMDIEKVTALVAMSLKENLADKTFFKNINDFLEIFFGDRVTGASNIIGNTVGSLLPKSSLVNTMTRASNEYEKEAKTLVEKMYKNYGFMLDRNNIDVFGKPFKNINHYGLMKSRDVGSIGATTAFAVGVNPPMFKDILQVDIGLNTKVDVKLTPEQLVEMRSLQHTMFNLPETLDTIAVAMKDSEPELIRLEMTKVIRDVQQKVKEYYIANDPVIDKTLKLMGHAIHKETNMEAKDKARMKNLKGVIDDIYEAGK